MSIFQVVFGPPVSAFQVSFPNLVLSLTFDQETGPAILVLI